MPSVQHRVVNAGANHKIPYIVLQSGHPGPNVLITAGIHGTEVAGIRAASQIPDKVALKRGAVIIVPVVNRVAYLRRIRGIIDLNRTFPIRRKANANHPISRALLGLVQLYKPAWCIDLHEANGFHRRDSSKLGQTLLADGRAPWLPIVRRVVKTVNASIKNPVQQFSVLERELPGSFRYAMGKVYGIPAVTVESGMQQVLPMRVQYQLAVVQAFLSQFGMLGLNHLQRRA